MTITTTANTVTGNGNGATTVWPFAFLIPYGDDGITPAVLVTLTNTNVSPFTYTLLTSGQYTILGVGDHAGGAVTYTPALAAGWQITIARNMTLTQDTSILNQGFFPHTVEEVADTLEMQIQQVNGVAVRAVHAPAIEGNPNLVLPSISDRAGKYFAFDGAGNPVAIPAAGLFPADLSPYTALPTGATNARSLANLFSDSLSVKDFGAIGDGATDDSTAITAALSFGSKIYFPPGTYLCNSTMTARQSIFGAGPTLSKISPFNTALAAITYKPSTAWTYGTPVENLGFYGTGKVGIGFTFGQTVPANYVANDEYANNVTFRNCYFTGLNKGVQRPFGNIGIQFNDCGIDGNFYGVYSLNNKFGGVMHAGAIYFRGGHIGSNDCGIYVHNTQDGCGAFEWDGTIWELNSICAYVYFSSGPPVSAFSFKNYWSEGNGNLAPGNPATVTLDQWTGTVRSTAVFNTHAWIFDGTNVNAQFEKGWFSDCNLIATNSIVISQGDRFESTSDLGGNPCVIASPSTSRIIVRDYVTDSKGSALVPGMISDGVWTQAQSTITSGGGPGRATLIVPRSNIADLNNVVGVNNACNIVAAGASDFTGSKTIAAAAAVGGGDLYADAASYSDTLTNAQFCSLAGSTQALSVGWWVATYDLLVSAGAPNFAIWDLGATLFSSLTPVVDSTWHTYGGLGFLSAGTPSVSFTVFGSTAGAVTQTFKVRNYQFKKFATRAAAQDFLASKIYAT